MSTARVWRSLAVLSALVGGLSGQRALAQADPVVARGIAYLRGAARTQSQVGETALIALALIKAEVPKTDPDLGVCIERIRACFRNSIYEPQRRGGHDIYEAGVVCMALSNLDAEARRFELGAVAQYLIAAQKANGSWDYTQRTQGDTSISQYAVLGLWEAENGGASVPPQVWDRAASWFLSVQASGGSWNYHRDEPQGNPETISMTAAGVGSLLICQRQLARYRRGADATNPLLTTLAPEGTGPTRYDVQTSTPKLNDSIRRGLAWLGANFTTAQSAVIGQSAFYGLYGIERIGALADKETLGRTDWFEAGRGYIAAAQQSDGSWNSHHGEVPNTVWAVLFLTKSTAKTVRRVEIKRLGAGTLLGGRGLPKDLGNLTVAGGRVVSRPMNGAVEGMLAVLEDPRSEQADAALAGLVQRYRAEGPNVLRPHKDRFRKLLTDRDPGLRKVAAWALARTADLDVVPTLIGALTDGDEEVVTTAREGLQLLSRKIEGLGPPSPSSPDQRKEAAARWREWYASIRPLGLEGQDDEGHLSNGPASKR